MFKRLKLNLFSKDWEDKINKRLNYFSARANRLNVYKYFLRSMILVEFLKIRFGGKRGFLIEDG